MHLQDLFVCPNWDSAFRGEPEGMALNPGSAILTSLPAPWMRILRVASMDILCSGLKHSLRKAWTHDMSDSPDSSSPNRLGATNDVSSPSWGPASPVLCVRAKESD